MRKSKEIRVRWDDRLNDSCSLTQKLSTSMCILYKDMHARGSSLDEKVYNW